MRLKVFSTNSFNGPRGYVWGGGHTLKTDPTRQGWRCLPLVKGSSTLLFGQRGIGGCASIVQHPDHLDVALYAETPEEVIESMEEGRIKADPSYYRVTDAPGWGLEVILLLRAERIALHL
jgi:hypothetical protein